MLRQDSALHRAEAHLDEQFFDEHRHASSGGDGLGGLLGAAERAGQDPVDGQRQHAPGGLLRLHPTMAVQWDVGVPLHPVLDVPVRLPVAH